MGAEYYFGKATFERRYYAPSLVYLHDLGIPETPQSSPTYPFGIDLHSLTQPGEE